jgi:anthranilate synthase component 1
MLEGLTTKEFEKIERVKERKIMNQPKLQSSLHALPAGLADIITPVTIYLKVRDQYPNAILLESSDYHGNSNSMSYICFDQMSVFKLENREISISFCNGEKSQIPVKDTNTVAETLQAYIQSFSISKLNDLSGMPVNGLFGYTSYDAVGTFDTMDFKNAVDETCRIPEMHYGLYRFVLGINHFTNRIHLLENFPDGEVSRIAEVTRLLSNRNFGTFHFEAGFEERSNMSNQEFMDIVTKGKKHCFLGDVFQVVLSRQFSQKFKGDEFNVYRALRNINPSPYLFYFDFGGYKLFGSSPEAQLVVEKGVARINPIAGTFKRTGNDEEDRQLAIDLTNDQKENAEHVMLVDLARNDLSRNSSRVMVKTYREVQFYSHVIHLVSEVIGEMQSGFNPVKVFADSFPAGTLSGAPKFKAMELSIVLKTATEAFMVVPLVIWVSTEM